MMPSWPLAKDGRGRMLQGKTIESHEPTFYTALRSSLGAAAALRARQQNGAACTTVLLRPAPGM